MNRQTVINENWVDRYLLGQLSATEEDAFEIYYMSCPETMAELETTEQLVSGFAQSRLGPVASQKPAGKAHEPQAVHSKPTNNITALAASMLAAVALAFGAFSQNELHNQRELLAETAVNIPIINLGATRGDSPARIIEIPARPVRIAFSVDIGIPESTNYKLQLESANGSVVWQADKLVPDAYDALTFSLPAGLLNAGEYKFVATPGTNSGNVVRIPLLVQLAQS